MADNLLGIDPAAEREQALYQGLLGLGSGLLANSGPQTRPVGTGQAFAQGAQGFMGGINNARNMVLQQAMTRAALQKLQQQQQSQQRMQEYLASLPPGAIPEAVRNMAPDAAAKFLAEQAQKEQEWKLKAQYEPQIAGMTEGAKNPALLAREEYKKQLDLGYDPKIAAARAWATLPAETQAALQKAQAQASVELSTAGQIAAAKEAGQLAGREAVMPGANQADMEKKLAEAAKARVEVAGGTKLTEAQAKASAYLNQMQNATAALDAIKLKPSPLGVAVAEKGGNILAGKTAQLVNQAQKEWAEAKLRFDTGAAAQADEIKRTVETFFPQVGDSTDVIKQKEAARKNAEAGLALASGHGAETVNKISRTPGIAPPAQQAKQPDSGGIKFLGFE